MQQIIKWLSGSLLLLLVLAGCATNKTSGDPREVLQDFFEALAKKDLDAAANYVTADSKTTLKMLGKGIKMAEQQQGELPEQDLLNSFDNLELSPAVISGDSARVSVTSRQADQTTTDFILRNEGQGWKVDFTMSTLTKMGMQAAHKAAGGQLPDAAKIDEAKAMYDSMVRQIDPETLDKLKEQLDKLK